MRMNSMVGVLWLVAAAGLAGCRVAESTRVSVLNETGSTLLVDAALAQDQDPVLTDEQVEPGQTRAFTIEHGGAENPAIQLGITPMELAGAPARWIEFAPPGPFLLRVQGPATDLRFVAMRDTADFEIREIPRINERQIGSEPPVNLRTR